VFLPELSPLCLTLRRAENMLDNGPRGPAGAGRGGGGSHAFDQEPKKSTVQGPELDGNLISNHGDEEMGYAEALLQSDVTGQGLFFGPQLGPQGVEGGGVRALDKG